MYISNTRESEIFIRKYVDLPWGPTHKSRLKRGQKCWANGTCNVSDLDHNYICRFLMSIKKCQIEGKY